jgi:hypothetical protein
MGRSRFDGDRIMSAVIKREPVTDLQPATTPMQLMQAMIERGTDPDQLEKMLALQERWEAGQARKAFAAAMAHFQANCPTILKSKKADRYNYAPLDEILRTIRPHLESAGLSVVFDTRTADGLITALCTVTHSDGHSTTSEFSAPIDPAMKVNDTQKAGSANSYAKRYALCNALNLVGSEFDDDAFSAGQPEQVVETATAEQLAMIQEYRDADQIPDVTLKWLDKQVSLTEKQAAALIAKLKKADK